MRKNTSRNLSIQKNITLLILSWFIISIAILLILSHICLPNKNSYCFFWIVIVIFVILGLSYEIIKYGINLLYKEYERKS